MTPASPFCMRQRSRVLTLVVLCVALGFHEPSKRVVIGILRAPLAVASASVRFLRVLPRLPVLADENAALRVALSRREAEAARLREALRHTRQVRTLAAATVAPSPAEGDDARLATGLVAMVISRSTVPTQHTILLDKGERDGLVAGAVVMDAAGVLGRVIELRASTAVVMLLTDPESRIAGLVERSRASGLMVGQAHQRCAFTYLDAQADVVEGDRVITAGWEGSSPKGLLLGRIVRVMREEDTGSTSAWVQPAARLSRLEEVLCLLPRGASRASSTLK